MGRIGIQKRKAAPQLLVFAGEEFVFGCELMDSLI
jgi:hypothetical protein